MSRWALMTDAPNKIKIEMSELCIARRFSSEIKQDEIKRRERETQIEKSKMRKIKSK